MSQPDQFISQLEQTVGTPGAEARDEPKVPFVTGLKLTGEQERKMIDHAFKRLSAIDSEMGRQQTLSPTWWSNLGTQAIAGQNALAQGFVLGATFLGRRSRYDATYENDVSWRPWTIGVENIFMQSNLVVPLSRRICRQMVAKAKDAFLGTDPWYSVDPAPGTADQLDDQLSVAVERFTQFKQREANAKEHHGDAIKRALVFGECAVKTSYKVRDQIFDVEGTVLTDLEGKKINGADGNSITPDDQFDEKDDGLGNKSTVLRRDGQTQIPDSPVWGKANLTRRQVLFEGAVSEPIYFKDFLCPLTAKNVQEADLVAHLYDKDVMGFVDLIVKRGMVDDTSEARKATAQKMVALIQTLSKNTSQPKSASTAAVRPNEITQSVPAASDGAGPVAQFAEMYFWFDANEDGIQENIMMICDRQSRAPVFYDHVANITTDGLRPIEIIRINPIADRWYGMGIIELFESYQTVTDLLVNRWNFSQSSSGRVTFWNPTNTIEGDSTPHLKMNWGSTYSLKPGAKMEETLGVVYLNDTKFEAIHEMIQFFMQLAMNESGVTNANDDQAAGMQSAKLATGILEVKKSGEELFQPIIEDLTQPLTNLLNREISIILANINPVEAFTYLAGDKLQIGKMTPDDVRGLKYKCTISLTTHKNQQTLQQASQAAALVEKFYQLDPMVQAKVAPFYRAEIMALCPDQDADATIQPMQPQPPTPPPADALKPAISFTGKLEAQSPATQQQLLAKIGITDEQPAIAAANATAAIKDNKGSTETPGQVSSQSDGSPFDTQLKQKPITAPPGNVKAA